MKRHKIRLKKKRDASLPLKVYGSGNAALRAVFYLILMSLLAYVAFVGHIAMKQLGNFERLVFAFGSLGAIGMVVKCMRIFRLRGPILYLDENGLRDLRISPELVHWTDIEGYNLVWFSSRWSLRRRVTQILLTMRRMPPYTGRMFDWLAPRVVRGDILYIDLAILSIDGDILAQKITYMIEKNGGAQLSGSSFP